MGSVLKQSIVVTIFAVVMELATMTTFAFVKVDGKDQTALLVSKCHA